jgi:hypothetical protein
MTVLFHGETSAGWRSSRENRKKSCMDFRETAGAAVLLALRTGMAVAAAASLASCTPTSLLTEVQQRVESSQASIPGIPVISNAVGGANRVTLSWHASAGAASYNLYYRAGTEVTMAMFDKKISNAVSPHVVNGLSNATQYAFIVTAVSAAGESAASLTVPATTYDGVATPQLSPGGGSYPLAQNVTISCSTFGAQIHYTTDGSTPSETKGTLYSSAVSLSSNSTLKAIAFAAGMADSAVETTVYSFTAPSAPAISSAAGGLNQVTITWSAAIGASSYTLYWKQGATVSPSSYDGKLPDAVSSDSIDGLTKGTQYAFVVTAVNGYGEGAPSAVATATTELEWTDRTLSGSRNWMSIAASSDGVKLAACEGGGGYIYTSADSGATWPQSSAGSRY